MKLLTCTLFILLTFNLTAQEINKELKARLDSIMQKDQSMRELLDNGITEERKNEILNILRLDEDEFYRNSWGFILEQDKKNIEEIREIINEFGYPGKTLVGEPTNKSAWYVIQHSDNIEEYFPLVEKAGKENELPNTLVAMMEDRLLMYKGLEQKYGTQAKGHKINNLETGEEEWSYFIWPIMNPENVNELRKTVGFNNTIEVYSKSMNIDYKIYTLKEAKDLLKE